MILGNDQRIQFAIHLLFDRARRKQQIRYDRADDPHHDLTAALNGKLRRQQRVGLNGDDNDQRRIAGKAPGVGVFHPHQGGDPGTKTGPDTAHHQHQQRGADHQDHDGQRRDTADKGADDTQHPAIADGAGVRFTACGKRRAGGNNRGRQHRPAGRFQLKLEPDKQRQHNGEGQLNREAQVLIGDGKDTHGD